MKQTFTVTGMTCGHCEKAVTRAITRLDPQAQVQIDREANKVQVETENPRQERRRLQGPGLKPPNATVLIAALH